MCVTSLQLLISQIWKLEKRSARLTHPPLLNQSPLSSKQSKETNNYSLLLYISPLRISRSESPQLLFLPSSSSISYSEIYTITCIYLLCFATLRINLPDVIRIQS